MAAGLSADTHTRRNDCYVCSVIVHMRLCVCVKKNLSFGRIASDPTGGVGTGVIRTCSPSLPRAPRSPLPFSLANEASTRLAVLSQPMLPWPVHNARFSEELRTLSERDPPLGLRRTRRRRRRRKNRDGGGTRQRFREKTLHFFLVSSLLSSSLLCPGAPVRCSSLNNWSQQQTTPGRRSARACVLYSSVNMLEYTWATGGLGVAFCLFPLGRLAGCAGPSAHKLLTPRRDHVVPPSP